MNKKEYEAYKSSWSYKFETFLEIIIFQSRWLLVPFFIGLIFSLIIFAWHFLLQVFDMSQNISALDSSGVLVLILSLVDKVLISTLVVMVIIGGYESAVSKLNISDHQRKVSWLGKLDSSSLKRKLSTSLVSISSVHLLRVFLDISAHTTKEIAWLLGIHTVMVATAVLFVILDRKEDY